MKTQTMLMIMATVCASVHVADAQQLPVGRLAVATEETTETNRAPIIPFLEGTDVFWTLIKKDSLDEKRVLFPNKLEANIFPHLVFAQDFTDILDVAQQAERAGRGEGVKEFAYSFSGTPAVRIRMLRDRSAPVRTPSYMPRGNFQFLWVRGLKDGTPPQNEGKPRSLLDFINELKDVPRVTIWEAHVIAGHHSNGQDGCLSTEQRLEPPPPATDGTCVPEGIEPTAETMNRIDGSFASQFFFRFGVNYSKNWMKDVSSSLPTDPAAPQIALELQSFLEARVVTEYEYHPKAWVDDQMRNIYGRHRMNFGAALAKKDVRFCQKRLEVSGGVVWNPGVVDPELDWSGTAQVSCFPWTNGGWGLFARFYAGQDYYNVGFLDDVSRLHVGLTFNQADFFRIRRRPSNAGSSN